MKLPRDGNLEMEMIKLHRRLGNALFAVAAVAVLLAVAACTGRSPIETPTPTTVAQTVFNEPVTNDSPVLAKTGGDAIEAATDSPPSGPGQVRLESAAAVMSLLAEQEAMMMAIYDHIVPSVVRIVESPGAFDASEGSGFVWDDEGHIVTNYHVIRGEGKVRALFFNGDEYDAEIVGFDPAADLAVVKIYAPAENLIPARLGDSSDLRPGQFTIAVGNPFGQDFTMTIGIVSAVGRMIDSGFSQFAIPEVIQTDAAMNPGNSGGPLLDRYGLVIGINTQIRSDSRQNSGVGFAVPVDLAKRVVPSIIEHGEHRHSWIGISAQDVGKDLRDEAGLDSGLRGTLIQTVTTDSPADRAGLKGGEEQITVMGRPVMTGGDVITSIEGERVTAIEDIIAYLALNTSPGDTVTLGVYRDGKQIEVEVELGERPASMAVPTVTPNR